MSTLGAIKQKEMVVQPDSASQAQEKVAKPGSVKAKATPPPDPAEVAENARRERTAQAGLPRVVEPQRCTCISELLLGANRKAKQRDCHFHHVLADIDIVERKRLDDHVANRHNTLERRLCSLHTADVEELIHVKVTKLPRAECVAMLRQYSDLLQRDNSHLSEIQLHDIRTRRTTLFIALRQYQHALAEARCAMQVLPHAPVTYFQIGSVLFMNELFGEAAETFLAGLRHHPRDKRLRTAFDRAQVRMRGVGAVDVTEIEEKV